MSKFKLKQLLSIKNGRYNKELNSGNIPIYGSGGIMKLFIIMKVFYFQEKVY
jgi:hypothetical protein